MRVLIIAFGSTGDVHPMIILGKELVRRGHAVSVAAFSPFCQSIEAAGLHPVPLPGDVKTFIGGIMKPGANPFTYLSRLMASIEHAFTPLLNATLEASRKNDALISTFVGSIPKSIAAHLRIPFAEVCYCPMHPTGDHCFPTLGIYSLKKHLNLFSYRVAYALIHHVERKTARLVFAKNGMKLCSYGASERPILNAYSRYLSQRPGDWPPNVRVTGFLHEEDPPCAPPKELLAFLRAGPCIYIGFGSMTSGDMQKTIPIVQSVLQRLNIRAVLSSGWSGFHDAGMENVFLLREYVPHQWLFQRVDAVAHHGGAGTTCAGLREGKPTLIIPFGGDQPFWGARVHRSGCGPKPLPFQRITEKRLAQRLLALQNGEYRENAARFKQLLKKENGVLAAADVLEEYWKSVR